MTCWDCGARRWLVSQYAPDPAKPGITPAHKPASMAHLCAFPNGTDMCTVIDFVCKMDEARVAQDYKLADAIRAVLRAAGIDVKNEKAT
jgi:cysteinyl-tRNA synthetase